MLRIAADEFYKFLRDRDPDKQVSNLIGRAKQAKATGNSRDAEDLFLIASCVACSQDEALVLEAAAKRCKDPSYMMDLSDQPALLQTATKLHLSAQDMDKPLQPIFLGSLCPQTFEMPRA